MQHTKLRARNFGTWVLSLKFLVISNTGEKINPPKTKRLSSIVLV
jgi:hypothetical protein